jgi:hypothetical protein
MHRRRFVKALAAVPAIPALLAQQPISPAQTGPANPAPGIPQNPTVGVPPPPSANRELPKLEASLPDDAAEGMPRYFTPPQFATLKKLSDLLMPSESGRPGALSAGAPEFLDFLVSESPAERKDLYRAGLEGLNMQAKKRFSRSFAELEPLQSTELLSSLRDPWTYDTPADPVARFLRQAKADVRTATISSREYSKGGTADRRPGGGLYWYSLD